MGEINPDNNTTGIINVITDKIACCCVLQIDEIKSPTTTVVRNSNKTIFFYLIFELITQSHLSHTFHYMILCKKFCMVDCNRLE